MPTAPALGGKLNNTKATRLSRRAARRIATSAATRAASVLARSGWLTMSLEQLVPSQPGQRSAIAERPQRPPNVAGIIPPSSSGSATIIVASTGSSPRGSCSHCSIDWNSSGWAVM